MWVRWLATIRSPEEQSGGDFPIRLALADLERHLLRHEVTRGRREGNLDRGLS